MRWHSRTSSLYLNISDPDHMYLIYIYITLYYIHCFALFVMFVRLILSSFFFRSLLKSCLFWCNLSRFCYQDSRLARHVFGDKKIDWPTFLEHMCEMGCQGHPSVTRVRNPEGVCLARCRRTALNFHGWLSETPSEMEVERRKVVDALEAEVVAWRSGIGYWASQHHAVLCPCIHLSPLFRAAFGGAPFACFNSKGLPLDWAKSAQLGSGFGGFSYFDLEPPYWSAWTASETLLIKSPLSSAH